MGSTGTCPGHKRTNTWGGFWGGETHGGLLFPRLFLNRRLFSPKRFRTVPLSKSKVQKHISFLQQDMQISCIETPEAHGNQAVLQAVFGGAAEVGRYTKESL